MGSKKRTTARPGTTKSDDFVQESEPKSKARRSALLRNGLMFDPAKYEYKDDFVAANVKDNPLEVHTTGEMIEALRRDPKAQVEARVIATNGEEWGHRKMNREQFLEASKKRDSKKLREAIDSFAFDNENPGGSGANGALIGHDFQSLLGGPFNKQLYYRDYLRMISACFFAYHHDPVARDIVSIITDFTMGRGFQLKAKDPRAQVLWDAFSELNDIPGQMDYAATELSIYGEQMWWWLPDNQTRISFNPVAGEKVPRGIIPRIRLIDPSNISEIVTVPEDMIKGILYYVWLAPTQYQMYSDGRQPTTKFIYTQIPAAQMLHFKINSVSNEKRGRSDYFPALGYMKRLRDSVNYSLVAQQKAAAWCIDTTIKGNDEDIDQYISDQQALGPVPPAGSEFVHTEAITRNYLSNSAAGKAADSPTFNWCLNMICMSSGVPLSYLGTHLSGGNTRASALVSTEPVAKRFERRRNVYERALRTIFDNLLKKFGMSSECEITFPELITQDRSAKLRDLLTCQTSGWFSPERCADIAAKEFDLKEYKYDVEQDKIAADPAMPAPGLTPSATNPLTAPGASGQTKSTGTIPSDEKKQVKDNMRDL